VKISKHLKRAQIGKVVFTVTSMAVVLFFAGVSVARADDRDTCRRNIERAEIRLNKAVEKHGSDSRQADERRHELNQAREACWNQSHGWWDGQNRQWHTDRDWDRDASHDHQGDSDRDHHGDRDDHHDEHQDQPQ